MTVASLSRNMVLSGPLGARMLFRAGINEILSQPELEDFSLRRHFGHIIDSFEENLGELSESVGADAPRVFIGRENPISAARDFSMIVSRCRLFSDEGVVVIINGEQEVVEIRISEEAMKPENQAKLQTILLTVFNKAIKKSQEVAAERMRGMMGDLGMDLPGLGAGEKPQA